MDISKASNFERFIFDLLGQDSLKLKDHWKKSMMEDLLNLMMKIFKK